MTGNDAPRSSRLLVILTVLVVANLAFYLLYNFGQPSVSPEEADLQVARFIEEQSPGAEKLVAPLVANTDSESRRASIREMFRILAEADGVSMPSEAELEQLERQDALAWSERDAEPSQAEAPLASE